MAGISANISKVRTAFNIYLTYVQTEQIFLGEGRGVTTLTNAVSGQSHNCSGNLEISPGIGTLRNFSGKHAIIPGHCRKKS